MRELAPYEFKTNFLNNQVYANPGAKIYVEVHLKSKSYKSLPRFTIEFKCPSEVSLRKPIRHIGYVKGRETRTAHYKIKSDYTGIYDLEAILIRKGVVINRIPIKFYVGIPMPSIEVERNPSNIELYANAVHLNDNPLTFCPYCGTAVEKGTKFCEYCGSILIGG